MARKKIKEFIKRRPSIFWWTLANLLAAAFAITSWTLCLYLFRFPERPANYDLLRKLKRLDPVVSYPALDAPKGDSYDPQSLLTKFYSMSGDQLAAHNLAFKRNYLTNFKKAKVINYLEGTYRVENTRLLTAEDFFHPGIVVHAQATVQPDELNEPSPYPVFLELLLPTKEEPAVIPFKKGDSLPLSRTYHRALILHAAKRGTANEPAVCLTAVPLSFENYKAPDGQLLPLAAPDPLNMSAPFPVLEENRKE